MKKTILALAITAIVLALSACSDKDGKVKNEVLATTKAGDITTADLYEEMEESIGVQVFENLLLKKAFENEYEISEKELKEAIEKQKDPYGDSFELYLEQNNITEKFFENQVEFSLLQQKMIESLDEVTDEQIDEEYTNMKKEIHARHILLEDKKTAEEVIAKLKDGGDFTELAKKYSIEPIAQETGGDLGWFSPQKMLQEFADVAFDLPENEISEPVKTSVGYHVIEVLETREAELEETFEELKPKVKDNIQKKQFEDKLIVLLKNANIDVKADKYKKVIDNFIESGE